MARYTYTATLAWGGDIQTGEAEVTATYAVEWGAPAQGPSYASGGQPADPTCVVDVTITHIEDTPWADAEYLSFGMTREEAHSLLVDKLLSEHEDDMIEAAADEDQSARDEWDDLRRRERDEDERYWSERADMDDGF